MNKNVSLLIGAGVGAGLGWFVGSVIAEIILIREAQENADHYSDEYDDTAKMTEQPEPVVLDKKANMGKKTKNYTQYFEGRPELAELVKKYNGDAVMTGDSSEIEPEGILDGNELVEDDFETAEEEAEPQGIRIVTVSDFANEQEYDTITLSYYEDEVVTDEYNNPIVHPEQLIGDEALVSFGEGSDDEDVVYVRNDFKKCMYEVVRAGRPYIMTAQKYIERKKNLKHEVENDAEETDPD